MFYVSVEVFALLGNATTSEVDILVCKLWLLVDPKVKFSPKMPCRVILNYLLEEKGLGLTFTEG